MIKKDQKMIKMSEKLPKSEYIDLLKKYFFVEYLNF